MPFSMPELYEGTVDYSFRHGLLSPIIPWTRIQADTNVGRQIARLYEAAPTFDENAASAYLSLRKETLRQFDFLTRPTSQGGLGVKVLVQAEEPYSSVDELVAELCAERSMRIFGSRSIGRRHPFLTADELDMFQAVFEAFGHASIVRGFDRHGAEAAWLKHSTMFPPLARRAMTTETRGQTCALLYASVGASLPQPKVMLLPLEFSAPDYDEWR